MPSESHSPQYVLRECFNMHDTLARKPGSLTLKQGKLTNHRKKPSHFKKFSAEQCNFIMSTKSQLANEKLIVGLKTH